MSRQRLKLKAKTTIWTSRRPHFLLIAAMYVFVGVILGMIEQNLSDIGRFQLAFFPELLRISDSVAQLGTMDEFVWPRFSVTVLGVFFFIAPLVLRWMMDLGFLFYARGIVRGEAVGYRSLFEGFNFFVKAVFIRLIQAVLLFGGLLLLILPGLFAFAAFSQANLLLLDHPDKGVFWLLRESARLMRGRTLNYLALMLSFLNWILFGVFLLWLAPLFQFTVILSHAVQIWLVSYRGVTLVNYYHELTGQTPPEPEAGWFRPGI